jgi:hypothetical protein
MSNIEVIKNLYDNQQLKPLITAGIIPAKVLTYMEIYYHVDAQCKANIKKVSAVRCTAVQFNVSEDMVYRAIRALR